LRAAEGEERIEQGTKANAGVEGCAGCAGRDVVDIGRRSFFGALIGMGSMLIGAIIGVPLLRYVLYPVYAKGEGGSWSDVGSVNEFDKNDGPVSKTITFTQRDGWRELLWLSGALLSLLVLGMGFTGYLLPWDQKAYFATAVGTSVVGEMPLIGNLLTRLMRGGDEPVTKRVTFAL
jgi:hypothetical protein